MTTRLCLQAVEYDKNVREDFTGRGHFALRMKIFKNNRNAHTRTHKYTVEIWIKKKFFNSQYIRINIVI